MGLLGAAHGWGWGKKAPLPKICLTYPTMMKLGSFTLSKGDPKNISIMNSADITFFQGKSATFVMSINTDIDCILTHSF